MKRIITGVLILSASTLTFAKKVKFSVDMDTNAVNVNGIHITGNFQDEAGFAADWDPASTAMTQDISDPSVYNVVVDIPAFREYEFKFVNGIFGYEVEFVPMEARVIYQFNDNRWIYIDSLSNDTQLVKPVIYSGNAPAGKDLLRFRVDMRNVTTLSPKGVHVAGNFQGWDPAITRLYSFDGNIFEYITYVDSGMPAVEREFKYYNGNTSGTAEAVPLTCANVGGNRGVYISSDSILSEVCFAACAPCAGNGINYFTDEQRLSVSPNPSAGIFKIESSGATIQSLKVYSVLGALVAEQTPEGGSAVLQVVHPGVYFLRVTSNGRTFSEKIIVE